MSRNVRNGLLLFGSVITLHLGFTFIKPIVSPPKDAQHEEEFMNKLKKI